MRSMASLNFKITFLVVIIGIIFIVFKALIKKKFTFPDESIIKIIFLFILISFSYGVFNGNDLYMNIKDIVFLLFPLLVLLLFYNMSVKLIDLVNMIINIGILFSIFNFISFFVAYTEIGMYFNNDFLYFRYLYRNDYLLYSAYLIPFSFALSVFKTRKILSISFFKNIILVIGLMSMLGRTEILYILFVYMIRSTYFMRQYLNKILLLFLLIGMLILVSLLPVYYFFDIIEQGITVEDKSLQWRIVEFFSLFRELKHYEISQWIIGNGLGSSLETIYPINVHGAETLYAVNRFHNVWLYIFFKFGIVGIILFILVIYNIFLFLIKNMINESKNNKIYYSIYSYLLFYFFIQGNVFGLFSMQLDLQFGVILYMIKILKDNKNKGNKYVYIND